MTPDDEPQHLRPTLLDRETGERRLVDERWSASLFQWAENGFSCDCNRSLAFGRTFEESDGPCRSVRYVVVDVEGCDESDKAATIAEMNEGYE